MFRNTALERAIEALRQMAAPTASVMRDGDEVKIPARDLVPGDVILLRTGDRIPADARLLETVNLQVEEAALTGESVPVEKHIHVLSSDDLAVGDRKNMVYAGTAVTYGRGRALVAATGMKTEFGKIAQLLQTVESGKTPSAGESRQVRFCVGQGRICCRGAHCCARFAARSARD